VGKLWAGDVLEGEDIWGLLIAGTGHGSLLVCVLPNKKRRLPRNKEVYQIKQAVSHLFMPSYLRGKLLRCYCYSRMIPTCIEIVRSGIRECVRSKVGPRVSTIIKL